MNLKKLSTSLLTAGLLVGTIAASNAVSFTLYVDNPSSPPPPAPDWQNGVMTNGGASFTNQFLPVNGGGGFAYGSPSVVKFGETTTFGTLPTPSTTGTFTNVGANFAFDLGPNVPAPLPLAAPPPHPVTDHFVVTGLLNGDVGYDAGSNPFSTTHVTFTSLTDTDTGMTTTVAVLNPNNGLASLMLSPTINGQSFSIFVNQVQDISAPFSNNLSISGFIKTNAVPEPGVTALLCGSGLSGTLLLRRRRA